MRYTIKAGDSLSKIAAAHGITLARLLAANPRFAAHPDRIAVGDAVEIPDTAPVPPPVAHATVLGKLSEKYETGGRGPGVVSSGAGDAGGASYGSYQMTSVNGGTVSRFIAQADFKWRAAFQGLTPGSAPFTAAWKAIAAAEPEAFHAAQHRYIQATHYDPLVANVLAKHGLDVRTRSAALQDVAWSTAVQHGPNTAVVGLAIAAVQGTAAGAGVIFDRALIIAIYAERGRRAPDGTLVYFRKNSPDVQAGVANRFVAEAREALRMLDGG
jgi:hypothetical protein